MTKKNFIKGLLKTLINHTGTKVIFIFAVLTVLCYCMGTIITEVENVSPKCGEFTEGFDGTGYECCVDCKKLDKEYFNHEAEYAFFGANRFNCYCVDENKNVEQVW